jgi:hypothetical protein
MRLTDEDHGDGDFRPTKGKANGDHPTRGKPVPAPEVGFLTSAVEKAIVAGPAGIRRAQRVALKYARKYQEAVDYWPKETDFLKKWDDSGDRVNRARARSAFVWRSRFLAALSMTNFRSAVSSSCSNQPQDGLRRSRAGQGICRAMGRGDRDIPAPCGVLSETRCATSR